MSGTESSPACCSSPGCSPQRSQGTPAILNSGKKFPNICTIQAAALTGLGTEGRVEPSREEVDGDGGYEDKYEGEKAAADGEEDQLGGEEEVRHVQQGDAEQTRLRSRSQ